MITLLAMLALAQLDPQACIDATPHCRETTGRAILLETHRADTTAIYLERCETKLAARTSTVIREMVPVPQDSGAGYSLDTILIVAAIAAVAVFGLGYAVGAAGREDPQTVVVR